MADAGLLRLFNFLEWIKEVLILMQRDNVFRKGPATTFSDRVFCVEMNKAINETERYYEQTLFKEAMRTGFFEYQVIYADLFMIHRS
jgi:leucyl-tRNA synthetase